MPTEPKRPTAIHLIVPAAITVVLCLGCSEQQHPSEGFTPVYSDATSSESKLESAHESILQDEHLRPATVMDSFAIEPMQVESPEDAPATERREAVRSLKRKQFAAPNDRWASKPKESDSEARSGAQPPIFELQPGEELWVIAASDSAEAQPNRPDTPAIPGCGSLLAKVAEQPQLVPVPLKHTDVTGTIDGYIASVDVKQQFHNPFDSKIEAVYVFPLPQKAAVNEFVMTVGDRRIRGIIREREQAEKIYNNAKRQGHVASLMTQERPNIFTQKVANIEPGKQIDIDIRYFHTLKWDDGSYEFVFPMVVGPRFNPADTQDPIAAVARGGSAGGTTTAVEYLAPNERSGHDISLAVDIRAGVTIEAVESVNHVIRTEQEESERRTITLASEDTIPNRDFVLRYRVAGESVKSALMTHRDEHGQYFTMMLYPPAELSSLQRSPMEMVFVLDCSGSMSGQPLMQSKAAVRQALSTLTPRDTFNIIRFSSNASQLGRAPLPATAVNVQRALAWLNGLSGTGGTQMIEGIKAALDFPHDEGRFRLVSFLTDGFIGNEQQILTTLHHKLGASRVFSFGVGQSPNRFLMDRMALVGKGAVTYLSLNDDASDVMNRFAERISHPALTDVAIDWGDMQVEDLYPSRLPDLVVGRPIVLTGRFTGTPSTVRVGGRAAMQPVEYAVNVTNDQQEHKAIAAVWARHKIADLMNQATRAPELAGRVKQSVLQTALNHNLMSSWTAFIAVDSMTKTAGNFGTTVVVPSPVPEGVKYETTVGGDGGL